MRRPLPTPVLLSFLTLLVTRPLAAQGRVDTTRVRDLVVTATRVTPASGTLAAATTVITGDDLRARGITFVTDALRDVPGMMLVEGGTYGNVTSLFLRGGESDYVKVLLDGIPLNQPGGSVDFANLTTANIDRIEIVRGPVSVLYGADAMSGVVQLFTRPGAPATHGEIAARAGTFGNEEFLARLAAGTSQMSASLEGSRFTSDGVYAFNSGYRNSLGSARLAWEGGAKGRAVFTARASEVTAHYPTDYTGLPVDHNQLVTERPLLIGLDLSRPLSARWSATVQGYGSREHRGARNRPDSPADTLGFGYDADASAITWRRGGEMRLDYRPSARSVFSLGVGLERETIDQQTRTAENFGGGAFEESDSFGVHRTTKDVYGQLLMTLSPDVSLQLGARLDHNSSFGSFPTARAGLSWQVTPRGRIWTSAGTAFKAPTFFELFAHSAFEVGNAALDPERSTSVELGGEQQFARGRLTLGATLFAQQFRDMIQYISASPGAPTYANLGGARSRGLETSFRVVVSTGISLSGHWTWLGTAVTDSGAASSVSFAQGEALLRRPGSSGGVTFAYHPEWLRFSATLLHIGSRDDVDFRDFPSARTTLPSYTTLDAAAELPLVRRGGRQGEVSVTLRAENLFDEQYEQVVAFPGRGRTVLAGLRARF